MQVKISNAAIMLLAIGLPVAAANGQDLSEDVVELRQLILEMRDDYERRIGELEARLDEAERDARGAERKAGEAIELAEETAIGQSAGSSANPLHAGYEAATRELEIDFVVDVSAV